MDMGGMDMGAAADFQPTNMAIARWYWYIVAAAIGILGLRRALDSGHFYLMCVTWHLEQLGNDGLTESQGGGNPAAILAGASRRGQTTPPRNATAPPWPYAEKLHTHSSTGPTVPSPNTSTRRLWADASCSSPTGQWC